MVAKKEDRIVRTQGNTEKDKRNDREYDRGRGETGKKEGRIIARKKDRVSRRQRNNGG